MTLREYSCSVIHPCHYCGAADSHDAAHARGCPTLAPLSDAEVRAIAAECIRGWAADSEREESKTRRLRVVKQA